MQNPNVEMLDQTTVIAKIMKKLSKLVERLNQSLYQSLQKCCLMLISPFLGSVSVSLLSLSVPLFLTNTASSTTLQFLYPSPN